jgi:AcrR family transcriptional regulator
MARLSKADWIRKGIKVLNDEGYDAIKIERLCTKFRVTKGSFYHHFESISDYEEFLLRYWEDQTLGKIREVLSTGETAKERLTLLINEVFSVSGKTELSLRAWALHNRTVRRSLDKMDQQRISVMRELYNQMGAPAEKSGELAEFAYTAWLGIQCFYIGSSSQKERTVKLINDLMRMPIRGLVPEENLK